MNPQLAPLIIRNPRAAALIGCGGGGGAGGRSISRPGGGGPFKSADTRQFLCSKRARAPSSRNLTRTHGVFCARAGEQREIWMQSTWPIWRRESANDPISKKLFVVLLSPSLRVARGLNLQSGPRCICSLDYFHVCLCPCRHNINQSILRRTLKICM